MRVRQMQESDDMRLRRQRQEKRHGQRVNTDSERKEEKKMKITVAAGSFKEYDQPMSVYDIAKDISEGLARVATSGEIDGEIVDLRTVVDKD